MSQRLAALAAVFLLATALFTALFVTWASPAHAVCSSDAANNHTTGSVPHGWSRVFCQPANTYNFTAWTNHGHGTKYVALIHSAFTHTHCDSLANASCSTSGLNINHGSWHEVASASCTDRFNDGHGFDCHEMEALP